MPEPARVRLYREIEQEFLDALTGRGIALAPRSATDDKRDAIIKRLAEKGARVRNGGASIVWGALSDACVACTGGHGSKTFGITFRCNRNCYFCFNPNQADFDDQPNVIEEWRRDFDAYEAGGKAMTHIALTGGEPLIYKDETIGFFEEAHRRWPNAHLRLYTAGDFLDDATLTALGKAGLNEIRISVKLDDDAETRDRVIDAIARSRAHIPDVMVEMPVIPGTGEQMRELLRTLDELDIFGINLLEFGFPFTDWAPFAERGFEVRNPPFAVPYNYFYAAGIPVEGSELLALELVEFAIDEGLSLGTHYCSLENKHRDQVLQANESFAGNAYLAMDDGDFFLKGIVLFGSDAKFARYVLDAEGVPYDVDADDGSVMFSPEHAQVLASIGGSPYVSYNIVEYRGNAQCIRELALRPYAF